MRITTILILLTTLLFSGETKIMSDYEMTNQDFSMVATWKFVKSYEGTALNYDNVETIVRYCHIYKLHPVFVLTRIQMESDLLIRVNKEESVTWLKHRAMGYGLIHKIKEQEMGIKDGKQMYKYGGFDIQVYFGTKLLRERFDEWKPGMKKEVLDLNKWLVPENASTYANYVYTPFYGKHNYYEWENEASGIIGIEQLYPKLKERWNKINPEYKIK